MNIEQILAQFEIVEKSLRRARLPFDTNMLDLRVIEVTLYELIKSYHQIENLIREIDPVRFGQKQVTSIHTPELNIDRLRVCEFCGSDECQSDHK